MEQVYFNPLTAYMGGRAAQAPIGQQQLAQLQALQQLQAQQAQAAQSAQMQAQLQQLGQAFMAGDAEAGNALAVLDPQYAGNLQKYLQSGQPADPYTAAFGDSSEGRQLAIMARQYAQQFNVVPEQAIFEVARFAQEPGATPIAVPAGGAVSFIKQPSLFDSRTTPEPTVSEPKVLRAPEESRLPQFAWDIVSTNRQELRRLKNIKELMSNPEAASALGPQNLIPGAASFGKYFRSGDQNALLGMIAGLQSMTYKNISGANVTAAEEPRLQQYVPAATDDEAVVRRKIDAFIAEYEAIQAEILADIRAQGYKPPASGAPLMPQKEPQGPTKYRVITK